MKRLYVLILSVLFFLPSAAQQPATDETLEELATRIRQQYERPDDRLGAIYDWMTRHIAYDTSTNEDTFIRYGEEHLLAEGVFYERQGRNSGFALLFKLLAEKAGVSGVFHIQGYARNAGRTLKHDWCVWLAEGIYFYDPMLDAGHVQNGVFTRLPQRKHYRQTPEAWIKDYMPFDPLWQCLQRPVTYEAFDGQRVEVTPPTAAIAEAIRTTTLHHARLPLDERLRAAYERMCRNGIPNELVTNELERLEEANAIMDDNARVRLFMQAQEEFNRGIDLLNAFVDYRNRQFKPEKSEEETRRMVAQAEQCMKSCMEKLEMAREATREDIREMCRQLAGHQTKSMEKIERQKEFLDRYYATPANRRGALFYK
ncbi:MAG: hypothetical protein IJ511_02460 [Bacteroides sp.]|nr:hypothetical protein [Bacteroides sp.]